MYERKTYYRTEPTRLEIAVDLCPLVSKPLSQIEAEDLARSCLLIADELIKQASEPAEGDEGESDE